MSATDKDIRDAISRIGQTPDGELLHLFLQQRLNRVAENSEPGTLQAQNGERILARNLMDLLSAGISEDHERHRSERITVVRNAVDRLPTRRGWAARRGLLDPAHDDAAGAAGSGPSSSPA